VGCFINSSSPTKRPKQKGEGKKRKGRKKEKTAHTKKEEKKQERNARKRKPTAATKKRTALFPQGRKGRRKGGTRVPRNNA